MDLPKFNGMLISPIEIATNLAGRLTIIDSLGA